MCGIAGYWADTGGIDHDAALGRMLAAIEHRGPDGEGRYIDRDRGLALGHVRLAIIDLDSGEQPLASMDGRRHATVNGEFYDYKVARAHLVRSGHRFSTRSDSEIVLPLYREHGVDCVHHLRGEFAFALFDEDAERLLLARDRFGVRPLYFAVRGETLYWGSEVKALLAHPAITGRLDGSAALAQMMNLMRPGGSAFAGIEQLRPGHVLIADRDPSGRLRVETRRYWDLEFPTEYAPITPDEAVERVADAFVDAVRARLEADVPVGCYLSGGIDSCSILGLTAALQQSPVQAFTIGFDDPDYDESGFAREMAETTRADQTVISMRASELYGEAYVEAVRHAERAFYNPFGVAKLHLSRAVREAGFRVVVTGEGSDELFGGYPFFKQDLARHAGGGTALGGEDLFRGATVTAHEARHPALEKAWGFTPAWIQPWLHTLDAARDLLSDDLRAELDGFDPVEGLVETLPIEAIEGRHVLDRAQYTYARTLHESQVLGWSGDRMDMAYAVESRPAFLDQGVADVAVTIPPSLRIRDGVEKWVLREAMRDILPEALYTRRKFAFMAPPSDTDDIKREQMDALCATYLSRSAVDDLGFFDADAIDDFRARAVDDPAQRRRDDVILNGLVGLHILHAELGAG